MARRKPYNPVCPRCDYSLRGLTQPVCPECGASLIAVGFHRHGRPSLVSTFAAALTLLLVCGGVAFFILAAPDAAFPARMVLATQTVLYYGPRSDSFLSCHAYMADRRLVWPWGCPRAVSPHPTTIVIVLTLHDRGTRQLDLSTTTSRAAQSEAIRAWLGIAARHRSGVSTEEVDAICSEVQSFPDALRAFLNTARGGAHVLRNVDRRPPLGANGVAIFATVTQSDSVFSQAMRPQRWLAVPVTLMLVIGGTFAIHLWDRRRRRTAAWAGPLPIEDPTANA